MKPSTWKCKCPEYNNHDVGAIEICNKCGETEPSDTSLAEVKEMVEELDDIEELVTDWDLCPFCIRKGSHIVGEIEERHKNDCIRPKISHALLKLIEDNKKMKEGLQWYVDDKELAKFGGKAKKTLSSLHFK